MPWKLLILVALITTLALSACSDGGAEGDADGDVDGDIDSDVDGDSDGDVDGDADGDADGDSDGDGCPGPESEEGVLPSGGSGGSSGPGDTWDFTVSYGSGHVYVYVPTSYDPENVASPVVWLFNESRTDWQAIADAENIILVDLDEYNDIEAYVNKINTVESELEGLYNVDIGRFYWAGWSAGGNIVVMLGSQNQDFLAGTMVFPGTGGSNAQADMEARAIARAGDHCLNMIALFYACGDEDANYSNGESVELEADSWAEWYGYETEFVLVEGSGHYISEAIYGIRQQAWDWIEDFNLYN